jgi:hypothetical protein
MMCGDVSLALAWGGSIAIGAVVERLHAGCVPRVLTVDPEGAVTSTQVRYARRVDGDAHVREVHFDSGTILHCTPDQLVFTPSGWQLAGDLRVGDETIVVTASGPVQDALTTARRAEVADVRSIAPRASYEILIPATHNVLLQSGLILHD